MTVATKLYTADDLWEMPTDQPWELWEGELKKVPGAGGRASWRAGLIFSLLLPVVRANKLGMLTTADGTYVVARDPYTVLVPDVAFVRWDRLPEGEEPEKYVPVAPDLVVEVRSPTDRPGEMAQKRELYRRAGVPLIWWVDSRRRIVSVYRDGELVAELSEADELDGEEILPGFRLSVAEIFA